MPVVKLAITAGEGLSNTYRLEIVDDAGPGKVTVGPADARDLIAEGRSLLDDMEQRLDLAAAIEAQTLGNDRGPSSLSGDNASSGNGPGEGPQ